MRKRLTDYKKRIDDFILNPPENVDWEFECQQHIVQIQQFQHERLIHLIVTAVTFMLVTAALFITLTISINAFFILVPMLIFLLFYLRHYFFMELSVIYLYGQYDKMLENLRYQRENTLK